MPACVFPRAAEDHAVRAPLNARVSEPQEVGVRVCVVCVRAEGVGLSRARVLPSAGVKHSLASSLGKHSIM